MWDHERWIDMARQAVDRIPYLRAGRWRYRVSAANRNADIIVPKPVTRSLPCSGTSTRLG